MVAAGDLQGETRRSGEAGRPRPATGCCARRLRSPERQTTSDRQDLPTGTTVTSIGKAGSDGRGLFGRRSLEELAPASSRPIFGHYGTYLGHGIVGGSLQLRRLSGRILAAQEDERSRIARELHDGASQELALFAIDLDQLAAGVSTPAEAPRQARAAANRARELSRDLHRIAYELHPAILDQLGLVPALRQFADQVAARHGLKVEVTESDWPRDLPADVSLALYRIAQEALQNAARHSGASEARVSLRVSPKGVMLLVSDQGRGFDAAVTASGASLGLAGMRERLRLVGGELCVDSSPERGTVIAAAVPRRELRVASTAREEEGDDGEAESPAR